MEASKANGGVSLSATGCYGDRTFDIDGSSSSQPLTDGLLVIRYLFGFSGSALTSGAVAASGAERVTDERISEYLGAISRELDIDGDGESKPLTDGLLLIRYLFGFSGDSLISGAIGCGAERILLTKLRLISGNEFPPYSSISSMRLFLFSSRCVILRPYH